MNRTEQPTPKRLRTARRKGQVAVSRELSGAAALVGGLAGVALSAPSIFAQLARALRASMAGALGADASPRAALADALGLLASTAAAPCAGALVAAAAAGFLQVGPLFAREAVMPRLDRMNPAAWVRRLVSAESAVGLAVSLAKVAAALLLSAGFLREIAPLLSQLPRLGPAPLSRALAPALLPLATRLALLAAGFGLLDWLMVRGRHQRSLRMTRDEVRREHREDEGDPRHRSERRRLHQALAAGPVQRATCVVVNPTHVAVALLHRRNEEGAPVVVAKGTGAHAARIRSEARRGGVPVVRNVALARALFRLAEVGEEVPEELYQAAAAVLVHVYGAAREERT